MNEEPSPTDQSGTTLGEAPSVEPASPPVIVETVAQPAKTLKAGVHGVPGGENMLRRADGSVRYFSVRESARLQTFPDNYELHGSWTEAMRQLGNAVPVDLAHAIAADVRKHMVT